MVGQFELLLSPSVLCEENFLIRDNKGQKFKLTHYQLSAAVAFSRPSPNNDSVAQAFRPEDFVLVFRGFFGTL